MKIRCLTVLALAAALLLSGCGLRTVSDMYRVPRRSENYNNLQSAIDQAMDGLEYSAPLSGTNLQTVQTADLDGDGAEDYLLFARGGEGDPMKVLAFRQVGADYQLFATIKAQGTAFAQVAYVDIDGKPGMELVVGRQLGDEVLKAVSVYSFSGGEPTHLMTSGYTDFLTCDLDGNGCSEVMVIYPGETDNSSAVAALYSWENGVMKRSREVELSRPADDVKRITVSRLSGNAPAVYVTGVRESGSLVTDIFAMKNGVFTNISEFRQMNDSIITLPNFDVYGEDIDEDGILELPAIITIPIGQSTEAGQRYLIHWSSVDPDGEEESKLYTFHDYAGGWYLELPDQWAERVRVEENGGSFTFRIWDEEYDTVETVFTIHTLVGPDREVQALENNRFVLYRGDGVIYAAKLEASSASFDITHDDLINSFHTIRQEWIPGET